MGFFDKIFGIVRWLPNIISAVENLFGGGTGDTKKNSVVSLVMGVLGSAENITAKDIVDDAAFQAGLRQAVDGIVAMFNASIWHKDTPTE